MRAPPTGRRGTSDERLDVKLPDRPLSQVHGFDRGTPIDRFYISTFLTEHAALIHGDVAEFKDARYASEFGRANVATVTIIDVDERNPLASLIADVTKPQSLPSASFDCILCTQAIQFFRNPASAIRNFWQSLRNGGFLLLTAPALGRQSVSMANTDYWRITPPGIRLLFEEWEGIVKIAEYGNLRACLGMLIGEAAEEVDADALATRDPAFPLLSCVSAQRPYRG